MAWDYRNPTPPQKGDGRYEIKYPNSYHVLDVLREKHYDIFKSDLNFNGNDYLDYFGCCETDIMAYYQTCKLFANEKTKDKKPLFTVATEKGKVGEKNQYLEFKIKKEIFTGPNKVEALRYIKTCIDELVGRNFNVVLSDDDTIKFIHVPFERPIYGLSEFGCEYTTNEFMRWLRMYYEHYFFYIEYVDSIIMAGIKENEREWLNHAIGRVEGKTDDIEIGPQLAYVNVNKKNDN